MIKERASRQRVGIEKIWAYPGSQALDLGKLAVVRGREAHYPATDLLVKQRCVNPPWEDPVTMAVNAALPMLSEDDRQSIELLIVGTESSPDQGKPISTFVHRFLGLHENCRNFETKHACYGGTSAVMMAAHWVASGAAGSAKALVIASDQARMHLGASWEYVLGAGAVALLISNQPKVLEFELERHGYWTKEVGDTFRPTSKEEAGNTDQSLYCYLEALDGALAHFLKKNGEIALDEFKKNIYHVPFGGLTHRAHRTVLRRLCGRVSKSETDASFEERVKPSLKYTSQFGGTYAASTFLALMGLIEECPSLRGGDRISIFAYGSGSCSEFYPALIGSEAREVVLKADLQGLCDRRYSMSVEEYEAAEAERTSYIDLPTYAPKTTGFQDLYKKHYEGKGLLILRGLQGFFREYDWS